ncbi:MAG: ATP-dependent helicase [Myxococcota bacterium]
MSSLEPILSGLNPAQRKAVEHGDGPVLVLAGAGSGKTRALTHRIAHLIASGRARPWQILAVTFTNKAAAEMRERVESLCAATSDGVWVATFHSTCARILRREIEHIGYERSFAIYDDTDALALIKRILRLLNVDDRAYPPRSVRARIDRFKCRGLLPADIRDRDTLDSDRLAEIYQRYQTELRRANALDFGDLILLTLRLFQNHPSVLAAYQERWRYILVDEYQDTNPVQYRLLRVLAEPRRNLCVVGDEDQSIYRFREADIRNILDFEKDFPGARVIRLERNYRSTQQILDAATAVVSNNVERKGKSLYTEREGGEPIRFFEAANERAEAAYVIGELLRLHEAGLPLSDAAIFYRTHAQSRVLEEELLKYDCPYAVLGGLRFYDRAEVKDALAYLRVLRNLDDTESLLRILNRPARGIGRTTVDRLLALAEQDGGTLHAAIVRATQEARLGSAALRRLRAFLELLGKLRSELCREPIPVLLMHVLAESGYLAALEEEGSVEAEARLENLRELVSAAEEFERANRGETIDGSAEPDDLAPLDLFLEGVTLMTSADALGADGDRLTLMTVHVAKGLEFPVVFMVGLEEGLFPHFASLADPSALEEERRICYVGMTRARDRLYLTNATQRRVSGMLRQNPPSRFLDEIPRELILGGARTAWLARPVPDRPDLDFNEGQWTADELPPLQAGTRIEHPVFGAGTLIELTGEGRSTKIRVQFDSAGIKTIVLRYAQLRLIP